MQTNTEPKRVKCNPQYVDDTEWELDRTNPTGIRTRINVFSAATYIEGYEHEIKLTVDGSELDLWTVLQIIECLNLGHDDKWTAENWEVRVGQVADIRANALGD
tara:strand:+ start:2415 stop:2726 length:312 start_codon:yes stop_codon:yes gene_type:complete